MPTGSSSSTIAMIMDLIAKANEGGDKAGKGINNSMASAIDDTSIGVSDAMGAVDGKYWRGVYYNSGDCQEKSLQALKPLLSLTQLRCMLGFEEILTGLTVILCKGWFIATYIEAGKKFCLSSCAVCLKTKRPTWRRLEMF